MITIDADTVAIICSRLNQLDPDNKFDPEIFSRGLVELITSCLGTDINAVTEFLVRELDASPTLLNRPWSEIKIDYSDQSHRRLLSICISFDRNSGFNISPIIYAQQYCKWSRADLVRAINPMLSLIENAPDCSTNLMRVEQIRLSLLLYMLGRYLFRIELTRTFGTTYITPNQARLLFASIGDKQPDIRPHTKQSWSNVISNHGYCLYLVHSNEPLVGPTEITTKAQLVCEHFDLFYLYLKCRQRPSISIIPSQPLIPSCECQTAAKL